MYSKAPAFNRIPDIGSPIYEVTWRLITFDRYYNILASGTCITILDNLLLTAKHVMDDIISTSRLKQNIVEGVADINLWAIKITNDKRKYAVFKVCETWLSQYTDIAILHIKPLCEDAALISPTRCSLNLIPPKEGDRVWGFGFKGIEGGKIEFDENNVMHIDVQDEPYATIGEVKKIHPEKRDPFMLPFPCYEVNFRTSFSMSGGPVFNNDGKLCGIISCGMEVEAEEEPLSYIASLWPVMATKINIDCGIKYSKDVFYPLLELAKNNVLCAVGWEKIVLHSIPQFLAIAINNHIN